MLIEILIDGCHLMGKGGDNSRARGRARGFRLRHPGVSRGPDRPLARVSSARGPGNRPSGRGWRFLGGTTVSGGLLPRPHCWCTRSGATASIC